MIDIKLIREQPELVKKGAALKRIAVDLDRILTIDQELRPKQQKLEALQAERNRISKLVGSAKPEDRQALKDQVLGIKDQMESLEKEVGEETRLLEQLLLTVPQPARSDVPEGVDDKGNVELRRVGTVPNFDFTPLDHVTLGQKHGMIDIERGVKLAGSRSYILLGDGALLEQAVMRYTFDKLVTKGYVPMTVPVLVKDEAMVGTGYFPTGREQAYYVEKDSLALVGTAEVSLTSYRSGEILEEKNLPLKTMAWSTCFRREAGTYGKDTQGLYRVHLFQKIEQVIVGPNDEKASEAFHDELLKNAEEVLQDFELPYRVVYVCTGDLGQGQVRKHDIETWMPSRKGYGETHSCSTFHEFQARRLKLRYRDSQGKVHFCHTLNNTAIASPRVLIALLECHQQKDGRIHIPEKLRPYLGGRTHIGMSLS